MPDFLKYIHELTVNGKPVEDDDDDTDYTAGIDDDDTATDDINLSPNNNTGDNEDDDDDTEDYTVGADDDDEPAEQNDDGTTDDINLSPAAAEDNAETADTTDNAEDNAETDDVADNPGDDTGETDTEDDTADNADDGTADTDDNNLDMGGEDDDDTDYTADDDDTDGGDDPGDDAAETDTEDDTADDGTEDQTDDESLDAKIKKTEAEIFNTLSDDEKASKNKELIENYIEIKTIIKLFIEKIRTVTLTEENKEVLYFIESSLLDLDDIITEYILSRYNKKSYMENFVTYNQFVLTLTQLNEIIKKLKVNEEDPQK